MVVAQHTEEEMTFGSFFRRLRIGQGKTLRQFCLEHGYDPANISRLERDRSMPPQRGDTLEGYARALNLEEGSENYLEFCDLAALGAGRLPPTLSDEEVLARLPLVCRTIRNERVGEEDLGRLIELIRAS